MAKKTGTSTGGIETSGAYKRKRARRRRAEEREWAAKNGPVIVRMGDTEVYVKTDQLQADLKKARELLLGQADELDDAVRSGS